MTSQCKTFDEINTKLSPEVKEQIAAEAKAEAERMSANPPRLRGFIKSDPRQGYCFVHGDDGNTYFLHAYELEGGENKMLKRALVEFTPFRTPTEGKCDRAVRAVVILEARQKKQS